MPKQATARRAPDHAKTAPDDARTVAANTKTVSVDAGNEVAERVKVEPKKASAKAVNMTADTQKSLGDTIEKFSLRLQGLSFFNRDNLAAFAKSSEIATKVLGTIGGEVAAYTKTAYEDRLAAAQDISTAKTVSELIEKQTSFAERAVETWAQQAARMREMYTSAARDIAAPLGERVSAARAEMKHVAR